MNKPERHYRWFYPLLSLNALIMIICLFFNPLGYLLFALSSLSLGIIVFVGDKLKLPKVNLHNFIIGELISFYGVIVGTYLYLTPQ